MQKHINICASLLILISWGSTDVDGYLDIDGVSES